MKQSYFCSWFWTMIVAVSYQTRDNWLPRSWTQRKIQQQNGNKHGILNCTRTIHSLQFTDHNDDGNPVKNVTFSHVPALCHRTEEKKEIVERWNTEHILFFFLCSSSPLCSSFLVRFHSEHAIHYAPDWAIKKNIFHSHVL